MPPSDAAYDVDEPVAVFLGPSLPLVSARARLEANYYPPARMGDVYRLVATGVRDIVLIDGVFHAAPSVWQRELLEAMSHGIRVIGAASMGALRAAELHAAGMIGVGTIFEWYREGIVDGDDEVALLHADASEGYRPLSLPLVDLRHRLREAVAREALTSEQAAELLAHAKRASFTRRSRRWLLSTDVVARWPAEARARLVEVLDDPGLELKARDAERALDYAASVPRGEPPAHGIAPSRFYLAISLRKRGFLHPEGHLVPGEALWAAVAEDQALVRAVRARAAERFYLERLAEHWGVDCPSSYVEAFGERWDELHETSGALSELRANGLTAAERGSMLERRAIVGWMIEQGPEAFGLGPSYADLVGRPIDTEGRLLDRTRAVELRLLAAWARVRGLVCPEADVDAVERRLVSLSGEPVDERRCAASRALGSLIACRRWLVRMQPYHFGYTGWSPLVAVLRELQLTGRAARIVQERW